MNLILVGAPGAGQGTQAEVICKHLNVPAISTGNILRAALKSGTELGLKAKSYMEAGQLVPDEILIGIIQDRLKEEDCRNGFILDGFPRTIPQAEALTKLLKERGSEVHSVIGLDVEDGELIERMISRGRQTGRRDDTPDTIKERLNVYHSQTQPLREFYDKQNKFHSVPGSGSVDHVFGHIQKHIDHLKEVVQN